MIEAGAIVMVGLIAALIYLSARVHAQGAARNPEAEHARLQESLAWHQERLRRAKEKHWDPEMIARIAAQLAEIQAQLEYFNRTSGGTGSEPQ